jgi:hypothetical protein
MTIPANSSVKVVNLECKGKIYIDITVFINGLVMKILPFIWNGKVFIIEP